MKEKGGGPAFLRWPWNALIYILLAIVLRIFAIPVILILMHIQRKNNPHGAAEGYCLSRTRKRAIWVLWSLLMLVIAAGLGMAFYTALGQDRTYWKTTDYVTLVVSGGGCVIMLLLGAYAGYSALRDTFFPAHSALAQSIRDQLPYPEEAPPVAELFAMVDGDLKAHGQWFDAVGIGQEWVLGDLVTRIDRIRGIFTVDKIRQHSTKTGVRTSRTLELVLIDSRWQRQATTFSKPQELKAAADCLALRVPEAARGTNDQYFDFWKMDESAQEDFERTFRQKQNLRATSQAQREVLRSGPQDMILKRRSGEVTSRVTASLVEETLDRCFDGEESGFELTPTRPIEAEGHTLCSLDCLIQTENEPEILLLLELASEPGKENLALAKTVDRREALAVLTAWLRREAPDLAGWDLRRLYTARQSARPQARQSHAKLSLVYASGAAENHTTFTQEDVQLAAEGIVDGTYQLVDLTHPVGYIWIRVTAGDKTDARCTVEATKPGGPELAFYTAKMPPREAAAWLTGYPHGQYLPGGKDWKRDKKSK